MIPETAGRAGADTTRRRIARGVAVSACLLALVPAGCGQVPAPAPTATPSRTARPDAIVTPTPSPTQDYEQFMRDLEVSLESFWEQELPHATGQAYERLPGGFVPYDGRDPSTIPTCFGEPLGPANAAFCSEGFIGYDEPGLTQKEYVENGDAAPAAVLAHEEGHWILHQLGLQAPTEWGDEEAADCLAGVYLGHVAAIGGMDVDDADEISAVLVEGADNRPTRHEDPDGHGDAHERHAALVAGIEGGAEACLGGV
jgi:uncharacterized protein